MNYLIFGGTGSLGYALNKRLLVDNVCTNFSRDEQKHWKMKLDFNNNKNLNFIVGDAANRDMVCKAINRVKPDVIVIAQAMKHIDQAEQNIEACLRNNLESVKNVLDCSEEYAAGNHVRVCFVSSDKACSPVNSYGMCKALCENIVANKALHHRANGNYISVRYGNVLNSNGSIIPILHNTGNDPVKKEFLLTHEEMTRFAMTLEEAVDLILYALDHGLSGETIIPRLRAMKIKDLLELFSEHYDKPIKTIGSRPGEKLHEDLINETQGLRISRDTPNYVHISSIHDKCSEKIGSVRVYNSCDCISKTELLAFLIEKNLLRVI